MKIILGKEFSYSKVSCCLYGMIYVEINNYFFPNNEWTDIPTAVIEMWSANLTNISAQNGKILLMFMEGPFYIKGTLKSKRIKLNFVNARGKKKIEKCYVINFSDLIKASINAINDLDAVIKCNNYNILRWNKVLNNRDKLIEMAKIW